MSKANRAASTPRSISRPRRVLGSALAICALLTSTPASSALAAGSRGHGATVGKRPLAPQSKTSEQRAPEPLSVFRPLRNQKGAGTCWAYAATGLFDSSPEISVKHLRVAHLVDALNHTVSVAPRLGRAYDEVKLIRDVGALPRGTTPFDDIPDALIREISSRISAYDEQRLAAMRARTLRVSSIADGAGLKKDVARLLAPYARIDIDTMYKVSIAPESFQGEDPLRWARQHLQLYSVEPLITEIKRSIVDDELNNLDRARWSVASNDIELRKRYDGVEVGTIFDFVLLSQRVGLNTIWEHDSAPALFDSAFFYRQMERHFDQLLHGEGNPHALDHEIADARDDATRGRALTRAQKLLAGKKVHQIRFLDMDALARPTFIPTTWRPSAARRHLGTLEVMQAHGNTRDTAATVRRALEQGLRLYVSMRQRKGNHGGVLLDEAFGADGRSIGFRYLNSHGASLTGERTSLVRSEDIGSVSFLAEMPPAGLFDAVPAAP